MRFELGAEGYITVVQGMIKRIYSRQEEGHVQRGRTSCLENAKKLRRCVQGDAFRGVVETFAAGWGPARQVVT